MHSAPISAPLGSETSSLKCAHPCTVLGVHGFSRRLCGVFELQPNLPVCTPPPGGSFWASGLTGNPPPRQPSPGDLPGDHFPGLVGTWPPPACPPPSSLAGRPCPPPTPAPTTAAARWPGGGQGRGCPGTGTPPGGGAEPTQRGRGQTLPVAPPPPSPRPHCSQTPHPVGCQGGGPDCDQCWGGGHSSGGHLSLFFLFAVFHVFSFWGGTEEVAGR